MLAMTREAVPPVDTRATLEGNKHPESLPQDVHGLIDIGEAAHGMTDTDQAKVSLSLGLFDVIFMFFKKNPICLCYPDHNFSP